MRHRRCGDGIASAPEIQRVQFLLLEPQVCTPDVRASCIAD
jgi:hypothetical protein